MTFILVENSPRDILFKMEQLRAFSVEVIDNKILGLNDKSLELKDSIRILKCIEKWKIDNFRIGLRYKIQKETELLLAISNIIFSNLKVLNLSETLIYNLEPISWMKMILIQEIDLNKNQIVGLKILGKCNFLKLQTLRLEQNKWNSIELRHLSQLKVDREIKRNSSLYLFFMFNNAKASFFCLNQLNKFQAQNLQSIKSVKSSLRHDEKMQNALIRKYQANDLFKSY